MLQRLDDKLRHQPDLGDQINVIRGDAQTHAFDRRFSLILLSYNALMHFAEQQSQLALLRNLRGCLADGGLLAIDLPNAAPAYADENTDSITWERNFIDSDSGNMVMLQSVSWLERATQILTVDWIYDEIDGDGLLRRMIANHRLRYFFLAELRLLLERCGFHIDAAHGDHNGGAYDDDSERMIVLAKGTDSQ